MARRTPCHTPTCRWVGKIHDLEGDNERKSLVILAFELHTVRLSYILLPSHIEIELGEARQPVNF